MVSHSMGIYHEPHDYQPILRALNLFTPNERRDITNLKFLNGSISGSVDAPRLLSCI